jgi:cyclopropane-fatty-acyl-phospholipid synthase
MSPLWPLLRRVVTTRNLSVIDASGRVRRFGDDSGEPVCIRLRDRAVEWQLALDPGLNFGTAYMDGRLILEEGDLYAFLETLMLNARHKPNPAPARLSDGARFLMRRIHQWNPGWRARRNVAHHYDIPPELYALFLDPDWQYSCAYFVHDGISLDDAQLAKKRHLAAKLALKPGHRVLDIGSGWGGLGLYLAGVAGARVIGVTLSREQLKRARRRAAQAGLAKEAVFRLCDYRAIDERFDRVVSVGMFEHVGVGHYRTFFAKLSALLTDDGVAVLHAIGRAEGPGATNPFIQRHIFPGGYIPALSEVLPAIERSGLLVCDIEILRLHYAWTLRHWRERFMAARDDAVALMGERFCRMWEFYLAGCELAFRHQNLMVFQIQLAKSAYALPVTRDYIARAERHLLDMEAARRERPRLAGE